MQYIGTRVGLAFAFCFHPNKMNIWFDKILKQKFYGERKIYRSCDSISIGDSM